MLQINFPLLLPSATRCKALYSPVKYVGPVLCNLKVCNLKVNGVNWKGLHFIHLNVNSWLTKIDELRNIAKLSNVTVIGISESKLDESVLPSEIDIDNYNTHFCDCNKHGVVVVCYIKTDLSYDVKSFLQP